MNLNVNPAMSSMTLAMSSKNVQNKTNVKNNIAFQSRYHGYEETTEETAKQLGKKIYKYVKIGLGTLLVTTGLIGGCQTVGPGERGVKVRLGKVLPEVYDEGIHLKWPIIESIKTLDVKTQNKEDRTQIYTKDLQQATVDYSVNYNLNTQEVDKLYKEIGKDYEAKVIKPRVEGAIKDVVGKTEAQTLIANRTEAANQVVAALQKKLKKEHIDVTNFEFKNIDYKDEFENAIEAKVIAEQRAKEAQNRTVQVEEEAKQKVIAAKAEAEAMEIKTEALSKNKALVEYEAVQKWDGKLPQYMLGGSVPFINLNAKGGN